MTNLNDAMLKAAEQAFDRIWKGGVYQGMAKDAIRAALTAALAIQPDAERAKIIEECAKAITQVPSLDENGYVCQKSDAIAAIRALALPAPPPAEGGQKA